MPDPAAQHRDADLPPATQPPVEPLRERRKRELRQHLSDVATRMFLDRGFDAVRVADVARACGVAEKTVFNHFRSKEALLADRWDAQAEAFLARLADPAVPPVDAALEVLERELDFLTSASGLRDGTSGLDDVRRFGELIRSTPSLVAHHREAHDRLTAATAAAMAERTGTAPDDPEPWVTATALTGLWTVFTRSLHRHLPSDDATAVVAAVRRDLHRAADALRHGF